MSVIRKGGGIKVNNSRCRRCSYCIQICPAKAIKLDKDTIEILPQRCILCGSCITECPHGAVAYESGLAQVKSLVEGGARTIACLDPSFPAAFDGGTARQLVSALKMLGFTEVWEGAFGAELLSQAYRRLFTEEKGKVLISSFCPVIVSYIQKYLPHLIPRLAPLVSPMIAIGRVARKIKGPQWKVVYITPCLAQMNEMASPEVAGVIDGLITFRDLRQLMEKAQMRLPEMEEAEFDGPRPFLGRVTAVIGGLYRSTGAHFDVLMEDVSVTYGHKRVIGALNQVAAGAIKGQFLDFVYCFGCVDGPFVGRELSIAGRRQLVARYANEEMAKQDVSAVMSELDRFSDLDLKRAYLNLEERLPIPSEDEIKAILRKIDKLPPARNLDCRACGYHTCRDKAIAVAQGIAEAEYCLPYLLEQSKRIYQQLEKSHRELQASHQELEQAHTQLIRTEKLAALGQLSAGVAHEINNPLGTITIYAHLLLKGLEADDPRREDVMMIVNEAQRAKEIVQGLLSFARETKLRPGDTDVNIVIEDVLGLVANQSLFHNITIRKNLAPDLPTLLADGTQLKQVFLNIVLNAAQAMEGKGKLAIATTMEKDAVKIRIQDTGPGIPPENLDKLFSPFFTTKEKGTGLGLAISYGIVERHGGRIDVETKLGKGAAFTISLPVSVEDGEGREQKGSGAGLFQNTLTGRGDYEQKTKNLTCGQ
jgi:signal transduction histidine kinase/NAD-dependent dihydropyrimidine dehydrogenase PreA subunit